MFTLPVSLKKQTKNVAKKMFYSYIHKSYYSTSDILIYLNSLFVLNNLNTKKLRHNACALCRTYIIKALLLADLLLQKQGNRICNLSDKIG